MSTVVAVVFINIIDLCGFKTGQQAAVQYRDTG
jgi:hypothetical protein